MKKIVSIGNALVDALVPDFSDEKLCKLGLCRGGMTLIDNEKAIKLEALAKGLEHEKASGGSAANTALALGAQNDNPAYIGCVGNDDNATFYAETLKKHGVNPLLLHRDGMPTGVAYTFISKDGERSFGTYLGAAATMKAGEITADDLRAYDIIYVEGFLVQNHELMLSILRVADEAGLEIALDMASYTVVMQERDFFRQILTDYVDIVFANKEEAMAYAFGGGDVQGIENPELTAAAILGRICRVAVVKMGAEGAVFHDDATEGRCEAMPVEHVTDTTAAGDFFAAGFLHAYIHGKSTRECVERGTQVAAEVIQAVGTKLSDEAWNRLGMATHNA